MSNLVDLIVIVDVAALLIMLIGICWSVGYPASRIWPPPSNRSWQYYLTWILFYLIFGLNFLLLLFDWNGWKFSSPLRFIVGAPLIIIGSGLFLFGIRHLGIKNTSGSLSGFVKTGPYRFTRNPQYLGDILLFIGLSVCANSSYLWIAHFLLIFVFAITPIAEEDWLTEQYGETYKEYCREIPRFL